MTKYKIKLKDNKIEDSSTSRYSLNTYPKVLGYVVEKVDRRNDYTLDHFSTFKKCEDALKEMGRLNKSNKDKNVYYDIAEVDENSELASELTEVSIDDAFEHTMKIKKSDIDEEYFKNALKSDYKDDIRYVKEDSQYIYVYGDPNIVNYLEFESSKEL